MIALLMPGQGSQTATLFDQPSPALAAVNATVAARTGVDVAARWHDARDDTEVVQLGLLVAGVASVRELAAGGITPDLVAGHSVGMFAAAVAAGALDLDDAARIVAERGRSMREAFPHGFGMAAAVGITRATAESVIGAAREGDPLDLAVSNAPRQHVAAGAQPALARFIEAALAAGAYRAAPLEVAVPSHTPLLRPLAQRLRATFAGVAVRTPHIPVALGSSGRIVRSAERLRDELFDGIARPVRWDAVLASLGEAGTTIWIAARPSGVIRGLAEAAAPDARVYALDEGAAVITALATVTRDATMRADDGLARDRRDP